MPEDDDISAEWGVLLRMNEEIDQLASEARGCETLAPTLKAALDMAWYFAEAALRESDLASCGHMGTLPRASCDCCRHFAELTAKAERIRGLL